MTCIFIIKTLCKKKGTMTKILSILIRLLILHLMIGIPSPSLRRLESISSRCHRPQSSVVRQLVQMLWKPVFKKFNVQLPMDCPLHIARDSYAHQELSKLFYRDDLWVCGLDGKAFHSLAHLDMHLWASHSEQDPERIHLPYFCQAEFCDIFRCQEYLPPETEVYKDSFNRSINIFDDFNLHQLHSPKFETGGEILAENSESEKTKTELIPAPPTSILNALNYAQLRDTKSEEETPEEFSSRSESVQENPFKSGFRNLFRLPQRLSSSRDSRSGSGGGGDSRKNEKSVETWIPPLEDTGCDEDRLNLLMEKCESLIYACTAPLSLEQDEKTYKSIQAELFTRTCKYLTCENYWYLFPVGEAGRRFEARQNHQSDSKAKHESLSLIEGGRAFVRFMSRLLKGTKDGTSSEAVNNPVFIAISAMLMLLVIFVAFQVVWMVFCQLDETGRISKKSNNSINGT